MQHYFTHALCKQVGLSHLYYSIQLQNFNLRSQEYRRVLCDLLQCYKIVNKLADLPIEYFLLIDFNFHNLLDHSVKLKPVGSLSVYSCKYDFFLQQVIKVWNSLPSNVIEATSLDAFKSRLSKINLSSFCKVYHF